MLINSLSTSLFLEDNASSLLSSNFFKSFLNFSNDSPNLTISFSELTTFLHEFGHALHGMLANSTYSSLSGTSVYRDFVELPSQIIENWAVEKDFLDRFAKHYKTGEVLPKETFDKMLESKKVGSGLGAIQMLQRCLYDMNLYDKYNPANPTPTDDIWLQINKQLDVMDFYAKTHYQANWIHVNTHPVYMYGYLWSEVYAMDMFTQFEKNGLLDTKTGVRYRELILSNGTQRDILKAVNEFLGRPSDNKAYVKSLGL